MNFIPVSLPASILLLSLLLAGCSPTSTMLDRNSAPATITELQDQLQERIEQEEGRFALVWYDLARGDSILIRPDEPFHAASTMKTPVMAELYRMQEDGEISLSDSIRVTNEFESIVDGSTFTLDVNPEQRLDPTIQKIGEFASYHELIHPMITVSSNLATNILLSVARPEQVNQTLRDRGIEGIHVLRGLNDLKAFDRGMSNRTTARGLADLFARLALGEMVSPDADEAMMDILRDQHYRETIPQHLPESVNIANKTGSITGVVHDSAYLEDPEGNRWVLVILSDQLAENERGYQTGADLSRMIYDYMIRTIP